MSIGELILILILMNPITVILVGIILVIIVSKIIKSISERNKPHCEHEWKLVRQYKDVWYDESWDKSPTDVYLKKVWECKKCKEIKETSIKIK